MTETRPPAGGAGEGGGAGAGHSRAPRPHSLHRYGQNHLVDTNILRAIVEQADVRPEDVVLEVGAADGQLTRPLLRRARLVHAFEIDRRFAPRLERLAAEHVNLRVHLGDALRHDLTALEPPPTAIVANLAYNIAIPLIMTTIAELPDLRRWAVMVQRELAERLFAPPSTKPYAAVSVLTQVSCILERTRPVPPSAFRPQPRVESSFVTFRRRSSEDGGALVGPDGYGALDRLVRLAFGQRRKVLANTLAGASRPRGAGGSGACLTREDVHAALERLGLPATARPEELSPPVWVAFARELGWLGE
jgi:16S rRNA (adenine1518-N6/adenine1519-N6)-dimethyltransferase